MLPASTLPASVLPTTGVLATGFVAGVLIAAGLSAVGLSAVGLSAEGLVAAVVPYGPDAGTGATTDASLAGWGCWSEAPPPEAVFGSLDGKSNGTDGTGVELPAKFSLSPSPCSSRLFSREAVGREDSSFFSAMPEAASKDASAVALPGDAASDRRIPSDFDATRTAEVPGCTLGESVLVPNVFGVVAEGLEAWEAVSWAAADELVSLVVASPGDGLLADLEVVGAKLRMVKETTASRRTPIKALVT